MRGNKFASSTRVIIVTLFSLIVFLVTSVPTFATPGFPPFSSPNVPIASAAYDVFLPLLLKSGIAAEAPKPTPTPIPATTLSGIALGIYQPPTDSSGSAMDAYIAQVGRTPAFAWLPTTWERVDGSYKPLDTKMLEVNRTRGIMPGLTWEPSKGPIESYADRQSALNQPDFSWQQIRAGKHDAYITQFAQAAAAYHYPFVLRVLHEMDGNWYPWGYGVNGNTNIADLTGAYRHIVDLFRAAGASNVQFVWNPTAVNAQFVTTYGSMERQAYPGDTYANWVALDGYNNNPSTWRSLQDVFQPSYQLVTGFSQSPMMLFEMGSVENPQDPTAKANWILQGFLTTIPSQFPRVRVAAWFNSVNGSGLDDSLTSSPNAMAAWKQVVASPLYQGILK